jgi:uncharacterized membrane protein YdbT with pleckstrin-like domain
LVRELGEREVAVVAHHWVAYVSSILEALLALGLVWVAVWGPIELGWFFLIVAFGLLVHAGWRALWQHMDRFVVTNMKVFRVTGVLNRKTASTPMRRILDITLDQPLAGRFFSYGHFIFESAAQEQGLREIRNIGDPDELNKTIQKQLIDQGLRGRASARQDD